MAKPSELRSSAWWVRVVALHGAERLPHDVLAPARHKFSAAGIKAVLEVQQLAMRRMGNLGRPYYASANHSLWPRTGLWF